MVDSYSSPSSPAAPGQPTVSPNGDNGFAEPIRIRTVRTTRDNGRRIQPEHMLKQELRGTHIGDRYVRVCRVRPQEIERTAPGHPGASEESVTARGLIGRFACKVKRLLTWIPITRDSPAHENPPTLEPARAAPTPVSRENA